MTSEADCLQNTVCEWNNGWDIYPKNGEEFCAPTFTTQDLTVIEKCASSNSRDTCIDQCKWRRGAIVAHNMQETNTVANIFIDNFCHPIVLEAWDKDGAMCLGN